MRSIYTQEHRIFKTVVTLKDSGYSEKVAKYVNAQQLQQDLPVSDRIFLSCLLLLGAGAKIRPYARKRRNFGALDQLILYLPYQISTFEISLNGFPLVRSGIASRRTTGGLTSNNRRRVIGCVWWLHVVRLQAALPIEVH